MSVKIDVIFSKFKLSGVEFWTLHSVDKQEENSNMMMDNLFTERLISLDVIKYFIQKFKGLLKLAI